MTSIILLFMNLMYHNLWILGLTWYLRVLHKGPMYPGVHPFKQVPLIWSHSPRQFPPDALHSLPNVPWLHAFWIYINPLNFNFIKKISMVDYWYSLLIFIMLFIKHKLAKFSGIISSNFKNSNIIYISVLSEFKV